MSENFLNGIDESLGDDLATATPLALSGTAWFVCSVNGTDAVSPAGKDKQQPLATLAQAQTNASNGDIIYLLNGHTETLTAHLSITKALIICGTGTTSGKPGATLKINAAAEDVLWLTAARIQLRNIYFPESVQANTFSAGGKVVVKTTDMLIRGCYFECGANDAGAGLIDATAAPTNMRVENCTFISTTTTTTRPTTGMKIAQAVTNIELRGNVFSDGTHGFSGASFDASAATTTDLRMENTSLLLGADALIATASTYRISGLTQTGSGGVRIA